MNGLAFTGDILVFIACVVFAATLWEGKISKAGEGDKRGRLALWLASYMRPRSLNWAIDDFGETLKRRRIGLAGLGILFLGLLLQLLGHIF